MFHSVPLPRIDLSDLVGKPDLALEKIFGFKVPHRFQQEAFSAIESGEDAFVFAATGGGKSLCYQLPALTRQGMAIVVSPLIALMRDQADALRRRGVPAAALAGNQSMDVRERIEIETTVRAGGMKVLLVSPERLSSESFLSLIDPDAISLVAIDEAHCVSQWGHDFRPDYLRIPEFLDRVPAAPRIALTASASLNVQDEIVRTLLRRPSARIASSADRANLSLDVVDRIGDGIEQLHDLLLARRELGAAIVYCRSRSQCDEVAKALVDRGHKAGAYHAGVAPERRSKLQDAFLLTRDGVMVATTAFGMGVDKPDVATVAHLSLPDTMEAYYQESGRAGRDGRASLAWLCWAPKDAARKRNEDVALGLREASDMEIVMSYVEAPCCRRNTMLMVFGQSEASPCGRCDVCLSDVPDVDVGDDARALLSLVSDCAGLAPGAAAEALAGEVTSRVISSGASGHGAVGRFDGEGSARARTFVRQCLAIGLLDLDRSRATLSVSDRGFDLLMDDRPLAMRTVRRERIARREARGEGLPPEALALLERLETIRGEHAHGRGLMPHALLSDARLVRVLSSHDLSLIEDDLLRQRIGEALDEATTKSAASSFDTGLFG